MKMAVLHVNTCSEIACSPTVRIAKFISDELMIPFIHDLPTASAFMDDYDVLFVLHGVLLFSEHRSQAMELYRRAKKIITVSNDYAFSPSKRMSGHKNEIRWTTVKSNIRNGRDKYINWNRLTWYNILPMDYTVEGLVYWGAYRGGRVDMFRKYFENPQYPVSIISYMKNHICFRALSPLLNIYKPFKRYEQLQAFSCTIILQDIFSRANWDCPANRFYESLFLRIPMYFDYSSVGIFEKYGYDIRPFAVNNSEELGKRIANEDYVDVRHHQHELWYKDYRAELVEDFNKLSKELYSGY